LVPKPGSTSEPEVERQTLAPYEYVSRALENYINVFNKADQASQSKEKEPKRIVVAFLIVYL